MEFRGVEGTSVELRRSRPSNPPESHPSLYGQRDITFRGVSDIYCDDLPFTREGTQTKYVWRGREKRTDPSWTVLRHHEQPSHREDDGAPVGFPTIDQGGLPYHRPGLRTTEEQPRTLLYYHRDKGHHNLQDTILVFSLYRIFTE